MPEAISPKNGTMALPQSDARTSLNISPARIRKYLSPQTIKSKQLTLLKSSPHPSLPIYILNYTNDAEWNRQWDDLTMAARVLVVERDTGAVVSRAFSKFFNWDEGDAYKAILAETQAPDGPLFSETRVEEKLDGSIITMFHYQHQWILTSKSRFDSVHVEMAQEILDEKYPMIRLSTSSILSRDKTYVFELIHPKNPTHVRYEYKDLVLLSIIGKDGSEPPPDFDWSVYPFPRPTNHDIPITDLSAIRRMNRVNEEGFVVKFYLSSSPLHPQRIKVKFESYLDLIKSKNFHNNPNELAEVYRRKRGMIYTFDETVVDRRMAQEREAYFDGARRIADDFGGEKWVIRLTEMWTEAENLFAVAEKELRTAIGQLTEAGYGECIGTKDAEAKRRFAHKVMQEPIMAKHKNTLFAWFTGGTKEKQVAVFVSSVRMSWRK
ncbi:hypothetical protein GYMLUDRAFT_41059 [Collybiopsis luxurians FD-317 M1]|uniref:T4 RNA ligase 1-like N-terminal domain-containing protein n=1 Tax=Collybiopsis luxurians FD-317 M1 TaxID=944289 RepID=A0A0D0CKB6_9AGAR|nr:hypothetical protein GYMLUDRAFT_41059 [Collybiopsis luxurians FD-317 M1]